MARLFCWQRSVRRDDADYRFNYLASVLQSQHSTQLR
jgi:hypothetical protein